MGNEKGLDKLFFELASESRLGILHELQNKNLKMQELARKLDLTDTEACRQLQRLSETMLIQKQADGTYTLTGYAKLVLSICSPLEFVSRYKEYFRDHDSSLLPIEFRARLAELSGSRLIQTTVEHINKTTEMFLAAEKRIDTVVLGGVALIEILRQRSQQGVKMRWLMLESFIPGAPSVLSSWKRLPEIRTTPKVLGYIVVTDKAALLSILENDGTMSYSPFYGEDASFLKWTEDLFTHEWEKAKPWHP
ncbi:MAG TPA: transcriptional regulator FilR1 domain-containing protein [Candidatus Limnocylindrales bacterium]|nr:transcriptional regulator FilR1 domain-containing protein [Candidatus Limnocylindrales bacterium]